MTQPLACVKKPERRRLATTIIIPSSRVGERVEVDRLVGIRERQRAACDHQTGTNQRHACAIDQARDPADRKGEIARRKDHGRGDPSCVPPDQGVR